MCSEPSTKRVRSDSHTAVRTGVWLQITAVGEGAPRSSAAFMFALSLKLLNSVSKKKYKANVHVQSSLGPTCPHSSAALMGPSLPELHPLFIRTESIKSSGKRLLSSEIGRALICSQFRESGRGVSGGVFAEQRLEAGGQPGSAAIPCVHAVRRTCVLASAERLHCGRNSVACN